MKFSPEISPLRRRRQGHSRLVLLTCALGLASGFVWAQSGGFQNSGSVIGDEVMYSIGGGNAVSMSGAAGKRAAESRTIPMDGSIKESERRAVFGRHRQSTVR